MARSLGGQREESMKAAIAQATLWRARTFTLPAHFRRRTNPLPRRWAHLTPGGDAPAVTLACPSVFALEPFASDAPCAQPGRPQYAGLGRATGSKVCSREV